MSFVPSHFDYRGFRLYHLQPGKWAAVNISNDGWPVGEVVMTWHGYYTPDELKRDLDELLKGGY